MKVAIDCRLVLTSDAAGKSILYGPSVDDCHAEFSNMGEDNAGFFSISASGTYNVPFGSVGAVKGFHSLIEGDYDLALNGAAVIQCRRSAASATTEKLLGYMQGIFTSISITNPSSTDVLRGRLCVFGDPA